MARTRSIDIDVNPLLWTVGWNWVPVLVAGPILGTILVIAGGSSLTAILGMLIFFGVPILAVVGLLHVKANISAVEKRGVELASQGAAEVARMDEPHERFTLVRATGESGASLPKPARTVVTLVVGESFIVIHDSATAKLASREVSVGDSTNEIYYDQVAGVNYNPDSGAGGTFWINQSDGHGHSWDTQSDASDALRAVQDRVREYKRG